MGGSSTGGANGSDASGSGGDRLDAGAEMNAGDGPRGEIDAGPFDRLAWWHEAKFGMFVHWGLYSVLAGSWNGQQVSGLGEWIMHDAKIPVADYAATAQRFNP